MYFTQGIVKKSGKMRIHLVINIYVSLFHI